MAEPKAILVLCQLYFPELVSTGQTITELCEELAALGHPMEVACAWPTVISPETPAQRWMVHNRVRIQRLFSTRFPKIHLLGKLLNQLTYTLSVLWKLLRNPGIRPVLVLTNPPFLPFACILAKFLRPQLQFVLLVFDVYPDTAINLGMLTKDSAVVRFWDWLNLLSFRLSSRTVVIGRCMERVLLSKCGPHRETIKRKMTRIHIWSDDDLIRNANPAVPDLFVRHRLDGKFVVLYSGNMGLFHDLETILDAATLLKKNSSIVFLFVGEGGKKKLVEETIAARQLANCLVDTYVPKRELPALLKSSHVGLASLLPGQEGLSVPSKTLGLMAAGIPVIAIMARDSEIALTIAECQAGYVVDNGDAAGLAAHIKRLEANPTLGQTLGRNGLEAVERTLNLNAAARQYSELFKTLA